MHILFVSGTDVVGGESRSLYQMVSSIRKIKPDFLVDVVLPKGSPLVNDYRDLGCNVYQTCYHAFIQDIPIQKWKLLVKYPLRLIPYLFGRCFGAASLQHQINWDDIDIIHVNASRIDLGAALSKKNNKPLIWHLREFGNLDFPVYSYRKNYVKFMNETNAHFIAVSDAVRSHWIEKGLSETKIIRIYNGVDDGIEEKNNYRTEAAQPLKLCILGGLHETKGHLQLIEALARLPEHIRCKVILDIVGQGNGAYACTIKSKITELGLTDIVQLLGYQKDCYKKLHKYDCGVMCSRSEGFGRVTVEYMMAGLPVIASDTGANPELVRNGENGLLYRWNDYEDLAKRITQMVEHPEMGETMGRAAAIYARKNFTARKNAELILNEYHKMLKGEFY